MGTFNPALTPPTPSDFKFDFGSDLGLVSVWITNRVSHLPPSPTPHHTPPTPRIYHKCPDDLRLLQKDVSYHPSICLTDCKALSQPLNLASDFSLVWLHLKAFVSPCAHISARSCKYTQLHARTRTLMCAPSFTPTRFTVMQQQPTRKRHQNYTVE